MLLALSLYTIIIISKCCVLVMFIVAGFFFHGHELFLAVPSFFLLTLLISVCFSSLLISRSNCLFLYSLSSQLISRCFYDQQHNQWPLGGPLPQWRVCLTCLSVRMNIMQVVWQKVTRWSDLWHTGCAPRLGCVIISRLSCSRRTASWVEAGLSRLRWAVISHIMGKCTSQAWMDELVTVFMY